MMDHAQWGLVALAFLLGLVLTFALTIRRVNIEVPTSELPEGPNSELS